MSTIVLIGFMGVGKTVVGQSLAEQLAVPFYDLDALFVQENTCSIANYFERYDEATFRKKESDLLTRYLTQPGVLATGGGVVLSQKNQQLLSKQACVVWLDAPFQDIYQQLKRDKDNQRPLFLMNSKAQLNQLYQDRRDFYQTCATITCQTNGKTVAEITHELLARR